MLLLQWIVSVTQLDRKPRKSCSTAMASARILTIAALQAHILRLSAYLKDASAKPRMEACAQQPGLEVRSGDRGSECRSFYSHSAQFEQVTSHSNGHWQQHQGCSALAQCWMRDMGMEVGLQRHWLVQIAADSSLPWSQST